MMKILIVGSGAREHALCWAARRSPLCTELFCAPGNYGIAQIAECVAIKSDDVAGLAGFAKKQSIDFAIVGPEIPLVLGLADRLRESGITVFGPSQAAAQLEGSKGFVKDLCHKHHIPTAAYHRVYNMDEAKKVIAAMPGKIVVKADGLAAGKGVIIAENKAEANDAVAKLLGKGADQHPSLVIEEFLEGEEASFFALVDGETVVPLCAAQDHKRAFDGDTGPNTGGMGAYSPAPVFTQEIQDIVMQKIVTPTARAMAAMGTPFSGVLFAGLMIAKNGPQLIEYNVRFGDPECQVLMPRLNGDWIALLHATATGGLKNIASPLWHAKSALAVVMAAKGYPDAVQKGSVIQGLEKLNGLPGVTLFHAATRLENGKILADGGRVLSVVGEGDTITQAQARAYDAVSLIDWPGGFCRRDIGWRAVESVKRKAIV